MFFTDISHFSPLEPNQRKYLCDMLHGRGEIRFSSMGKNMAFVDDFPDFTVLRMSPKKLPGYSDANQFAGQFPRLSYTTHGLQSYSRFFSMHIRM